MNLSYFTLPELLADNWLASKSEWSEAILGFSLEVVLWTDDPTARRLDGSLRRVAAKEIIHNI